VEVIIQQEQTGCGIASVANILGLPYAEVKARANAMGIFASDETLYSDTGYVRRLLQDYGVQSSGSEISFVSWQALPDTALLSIKHHYEYDQPFWHWAVFKRIQGVAVVLDSAAYLDSNERTDFQTMQPKWFIEITE